MASITDPGVTSRELRLRAARMRVKVGNDSAYTAKVRRRFGPASLVNADFQQIVEEFKAKQ